MSLRIQSGSARGRSIKHVPKGHEVRPILARIRKSLFDILRPRMQNTCFLDLYAGTGAVGIEALSNGARQAVFVDMSRTSCVMAEKNLQAVGLSDKGEVHRLDASQNLDLLQGRTFDIIFMGPPYKDESKKPLALTVPTLLAIEHASLAGPRTWVIGQHHEKEPLTDLSPAWEIFRQKEYGDSVLTFFRLKGR